MRHPFGLLPVATAAALLAAAAAQASPEESLNKAGCTGCHSKDQKIIGPAFKDVAAKYKGQDAADKLVEKVRKGGAGSFGPVPMPPHPADRIGDAELKEAVTWILQQG